MGPYRAKELEDGSDSEVEKSSNSSSESSGSASESESDAGSVHSKQSSGSGSGSSVKSNNSQDKHSDKNNQSSSPDEHSSSDDDEDGEGKLVLDEQKSRSSSRSSSSAKSESSNKDREVDEDQSSPLNKKRKHAILSDEESQEKSDNDNEDQENKASATAEALFGEAGDISSENDGEEESDDETKQPQRTKDESEEDEEAKDSDKDAGEKRENERDKEPEEPIPETKIEHEIPYIRADVGKEFHFVKLPNFLSVEPRPYDPETYEDEIDEEETLDEEGRARLKLKVENTIRWRTSFDKEGNAIKESNARMVRWSDGSLSLLLGSEVFDVYRQPLQGDHNHLFIRQGTGLQGQAVFRTKLTFRPHSTDSFTHRKMTLSLADRSQKTSAIKILGTVGKDPEAHRSEMIKKEEDRLRASMRRDSKQKRIRERTAAGRGLSSSYLEPDRGGYEDSEEEGAISLSAIKNKYKRGGDLRPSIYSSEEDASDIEGRKAKKLERAKALQDSDEEDGGTSGGGTRTRTVSDSDDNSD